MISIEQILTPGRSLVNVPGGSKKRVLEQIASLVARDLTGVDEQDIFESLIAREKLAFERAKGDREAKARRAANRGHKTAAKSATNH